MNLTASSALPDATSIRRQSDAYGLLIFATFAVPLFVSLFFKENWLWMDEVLSTLLVFDPSFTHMNAAVVSGLDANPPLFPNLYWGLAHFVSENIYFLRGVSIALFAGSLVIFYRFTNRLISAPVTNLVLIMVAASATYLNFTLATQLRGYATFFAVGLIYFIATHRLLLAPRNQWNLVAHFCAGALLIFAHNFGLFYLSATGALFALLTLFTRGKFSFQPLLSLALVFALWTLLWLPHFLVQTRAGEPHSWIPLPTWQSFFSIAGELAPSLSSRFERIPLFSFFPLLRFIVIAGLFLYLAPKKLKLGYEAVRSDPAFVFYFLSGWIYFLTLAIAVVVSFAHTSVFISRYLWPSQLLVMYQLVYAFHHFARSRPAFPSWLPAIAAVLVATFIFVQNRKVVVFPKGIVSPLAALPHHYPVFVETADYFLPLSFHHTEIPVHYVLDWGSAVDPRNLLSATVENQIMSSVRENYALPGIEHLADFNAKKFPHFYVVDEASIVQFERYLSSDLIRVVTELPTTIPAHRILECEFTRGVVP